MFQTPNGNTVLVDLFDTVGGHTHDYVLRVNASQFDTVGLTFSPCSRPFEGEFEPGPFDFRSAGSVEQTRLSWGDPGVRTHILSRTDELINFKSPAWRNRTEVFEEPDRSWDAIVLRAEGKRTRHLLVYEIGNQDSRIVTATACDRDGHAEVTLSGRDYSKTITIGDGTSGVV